MGRKKPHDETEILSANLDIVEEKFSREIEAYLDTKETGDLWALVEQGERLKDAVKIRNGFVYLALKRKVGHTFFKKELAERGKKYPEVWDCMCYARAVQRFPGFAGKLTGHAMRHILQVPSDAVLRIESSITGIPADDAKKITREAIEVEYRKIQAEKQTGKHRKSDNRQPADLPTDLEILTTQALVALRQIEGLTIPKREWDLAKQRCREIAIAWDHAAYNMYDPEHASIPPWELGNSDDISTDEEDEAGDEAR